LPAAPPGPPPPLRGPHAPRCLRAGQRSRGPARAAVDISRPRGSESNLLVFISRARAPPHGWRSLGPLSRNQGMSALAPTLQAFFTDRLVGQRQASPHTLAAYRDTMRLLVR